jgi:CDP-diglyceride synthetase
MLKTRVITAVVMLAVLLPVTLFAPLAGFGALIGVVLVFAAWEWARLLKLGATGAVVYALAAALALAATVPLGVGAASSRPLFMAAGVFWLLVGPFALRRAAARGRCVAAVPARGRLRGVRGLLARARRRTCAGRAVRAVAAAGRLARRYRRILRRQGVRQA